MKQEDLSEYFDRVVADTFCEPPELTDEFVFPPIEEAKDDGLLALGGDLSVERLWLAYRSGIFPWFGEEEMIRWYSPDPRMVLFPGQLRVQRSLERILKSGKFETSRDRDFRAVITACRATHKDGGDGTWITDDMVEAYCSLHEAGYAHSVETWQDGKLVGGLYGVEVGTCFCGESMFTAVSNASKVAFVELVRNGGYSMIDCQMETDHLASFGAVPIPRTEFLERLQKREQLLTGLPRDKLVAGRIGGI